MSQTDKIIGIDLGTTNSVLGLIQGKEPVLLPVLGKRLLPSVVGISIQGDLLVGEPARNQWVVSPERTIRSVKRKMGRGETVTMAGKEYTPQEISAFILRQIKQAAEESLGQPVQRAVITVPAYFNEVQRQATLEAGAIAGLDVVRIINEPTAAALAYGYGVKGDEHMRMLVYDLGGGTFDVSIIELNSGVVDVMATAGDNLLGGDDFDERLAGMLADQFEEENGINLRQNHQAWARLLREAEEAKIRLSFAPFTTISLEYIAKDKTGKALHLQKEINRSEFETLIDDMLQRTITCIDQALNDVKLKPGDIDRVLLVGGSTRIPAVWRLVAERMQQEPHDEIDPDAAVALGAAVQAGIIAGDEIDAILVDVTPLSLGIETARYTMSGQLQADHFVPLIRRNSTIPVQKSEIFTTLFPGQKEIQVKVYQGENRQASHNVLLGDFMVDELKSNRPDGLADVTVDFQIDVNGILNVTVTDRSTGKKTSERLKADRQRLSPEQIAESQSRLDSAYLNALHDDFAEDDEGYVDIESEDDDETPGEITFDPGTLALMDRARLVLENPGADPELCERIRAVLGDITDAAAQGDNANLQGFCDDLIDLLFEAEE